METFPRYHHGKAYALTHCKLPTGVPSLANKDTPTSVSLQQDFLNSCCRRFWPTLPADRIASDSSPAAVAEGPNLQIWVGPSEISDETADLKDYLSSQEGCSVDLCRHSADFRPFKQSAGLECHGKFCHWIRAHASESHKNWMCPCE